MHEATGDCTRRQQQSGRCQTYRTHRKCLPSSLERRSWDPHASSVASLPVLMVPGMPLAPEPTQSKGWSYLRSQHLRLGQEVLPACKPLPRSPQGSPSSARPPPPPPMGVEGSGGRGDSSLPQRVDLSQLLCSWGQAFGLTRSFPQTRQSAAAMGQEPQTPSDCRPPRSPSNGKWEPRTPGQEARG